MTIKNFGFVIVDDPHDYVVSPQDRATLWERFANMPAVRTIELPHIEPRRDFMLEGLKSMRHQAEMRNRKAPKPDRSIKLKGIRP